VHEPLLLRVVVEALGLELVRLPLLSVQLLGVELLVLVFVGELELNRRVLLVHL
jgi:hypothetical protein